MYTCKVRKSATNAHGAYRANKIYQQENGNKEQMQSTKVHTFKNNKLHEVKYNIQKYKLIQFISKIEIE